MRKEYGMALLNGAVAGWLAYMAVTTQAGWGWGLIMAAVSGGNLVTAMGYMIRAHFPNA